MTNIKQNYVGGPIIAIFLFNTLLSSHNFGKDIISNVPDFFLTNKSWSSQFFQLNFLDKWGDSGYTRNSTQCCCSKFSTLLFFQTSSNINLSLKMASLLIIQEIVNHPKIREVKISEDLRGLRISQKILK